MKNTETKKTKSLIVLMAMAITFSFVISCEEDEKLETKAGFTSSKAGPASNTSTAGRITNVNFDGTEGGPIDLTMARKWVANYRNKSNDPDEIVAHYFGFEIIKDILGQANCVGIRIYYALDDAGEKKLILVGVDAKGENLLPSAGGRTADDGNTAADYSLPCPSYCPDTEL